MNSKLKWTAVGIGFLTSIGFQAQVSSERVVSIEELFELTKENHPNLAVSKADIQIAKQAIEVAKMAKLPSANASLQAYYLADAHLIDRDFSNSTRIEMPHFGNTFSVDASQLIWKDGVIRNSIKSKELQAQLSELSYESNEQNIKLLVLGYYLDLYKLVNQKSVYEQNILLAQQRLDNINTFYKEGMVTRNDAIRGELQLSNLKLALEVVENNRQILNKQLTTALGLSDSVEILPDESMLQRLPQALNLTSYRESISSHPVVLMNEKRKEIFETSEEIAKAERMPSLSAFMGNKLSRPVTTSSPALDMYTNGWSAGLSLDFSIDALYKTPKKMKQIQFEKGKVEAQSVEATKMIDVAIHAAFIKYKESLSQNTTLKTNQKLAEENYRIMNSKYNNQLAILLDLIDASNAKLDAELQFANSEISMIYAYYKLQKESGTLN
ncbi:TolC family protein [Chryseobacterium sp. A321]